MTLERDIERRLVNGVKKLGGRAFKWVSPGNVGVPDRIIILPGGRVVFVELKTETGAVRPVQKVMISLLRGLGCDVRVLKGQNAVDEFLEEMMR